MRPPRPSQSWSRLGSQAGCQIGVQQPMEEMFTSLAAHGEPSGVIRALQTRRRSQRPRPESPD